MAVFLLCLVSAGLLFLVCYAGWYYGQKKKVSPETKAFMEVRENKAKILENIYKGAKNRKEKIPGSESLKVAIMENHNITPEKMRACLKELKKEKLVIESEEHVALTTFGVQFHEIFGKKTQPRKKK